jgi:hypothetical protein
MNEKNLPMKQALKDYYADKSLSDAQLTLLQNATMYAGESSSQNLNKADSYKWPGKWHGKWAGSMLASFVLFASILGYFHRPELITFAYADIHKDSQLNNGLAPSMRQWLDENNIASVPEEFPVKMSKFCRLNQVLTTHIRIAGKQQGEMNVFIHQGEPPLYWRDRSGSFDDMKWKLVKVREDLTLIVLYTLDMREKSVQNILYEMLPELKA